MRLATLACAAAMALPVPATAQENWDYTVSLYGWFSGLGSTVETPRGDLETELDFGDVWDALDMAFFGAFEARNGRWALVTDLVYSDLSSDKDTPFGVRFSKGEVESRMTLLSAYAAYAVMDDPGLRFEVAGGFRYNDVKLDARLLGTGTLPDEKFSSSDSWVDLLVAARARADFSEDWFGNAYFDVGGFGFDDSSDLTWQAYAGVGYRINETWSAQFGYRYLSIERDFGGRDVTLDISGPLLGMQASF